MHINKIQSINNSISSENQASKNPNFRGVGTALLSGANRFFQLCDDVPIIGVSFMDGASAIAPRTVVDLNQAGIPAAAETFRRESSGLIVNCLIPGAFVYGAAKLSNDSWMKNFTTMSGNPINLKHSWANGETVENLVNVWKEYSGIETDIKGLTGNAQQMAEQALRDRPFGTKGFITSALTKIEGLNGVNSYEKLADHQALIDKAAEILKPQFKHSRPKGIIESFKYTHQRNKAIQNAYDVLVKGEYTYKDRLGRKITEVIEEGGGLRASQNLRFEGRELASDLKSFLRDTVDIGEALSNSKSARMNPNEFTKKVTGLINTKSLLGLAAVIPLAMSMQYINRAITRKKYNKSGAPIYKDFENETRVLTKKEKKQLAITKPFAVASIVGLAALSMGKSFPKSFKQFGEMLQFNGKFPSLNQCRIIATATFASRMLASEDPNELRESTVRDLASFAGLYFLGDYAEKLAATGIQKFSKAGRNGSLQMFNRTKDPSEYKNAFQKFTGWIKDVKVKSFDEIPKQFKGHRSLAKIGGLGFSIALLGVVLPMYNKYVTNKKEMKRKELLKKQRQHSNTYNPENIFPKKELTPEEIKMASINESRMKFKDWGNYSDNSAFSSVASKFIK